MLTTESSNVDFAIKKSNQQKKHKMLNEYWSKFDRDKNDHCITLQKSIPICSIIIICFVLIHGTEKDTDNNSIMEPISWWRYIDSDILY